MISTAPLRTTRRCSTGSAPCGEDRRAGEVELDLGRAGDELDVGGVERVERRVRRRKSATSASADGALEDLL